MRMHDSNASDTLHESFLSFAGFRYLKLALALCLVCVMTYICARPPASGGTWLGYSLGTIGALLIAWLALLGVRKRSYHATLGTVKGWASAHVYLGLSLVVVATLHCGFHFGWNVHTLAYALMIAVVASGIYGIVAYGRLPAQITGNRAGGTLEAWIEELDDIAERSLKVADQIGPDVHQVLIRSAERVRIGGSLRDQLFGPRMTKAVDRQYEQLRQQLATTLRSKTGRFTSIQMQWQTLSPTEKKPRRVTVNVPDAQSTVMFMADQLSGMDQDARDAEHIRSLLDLLARRHDLVTRINRDIRLHALMQIWLYVHVPLTFALLAALIVHIVSVFLYR